MAKQFFEIAEGTALHARLEHAKCLVSELLPLFEQTAVFSKTLEEQGIDDFLVQRRYLDSFARSEIELSLSNDIRLELARRAFWFLSMSSAGVFPSRLSPSPFDGDWIEQMLAKEKETLVEQGNIERANRLCAGDLDPCTRREQAWSAESFQNWRYGTIEIREDRLRRRDEIASSIFPAIRNVEDQASDIQCFIEEHMLAALKDASFKRIKKSNKNSVVLAKRLNADLELRFHIVAVSDLSLTNFGSMLIGPGGQERCSQPNVIDLHLYLHRRASDTRRFGDTAEMKIPYECLVPLVGYGLYRNAGHIAVAMEAWGTLYRMVAHRIEEACIKCWQPQ